jgi:hypothetical protein
MPVLAGLTTKKRDWKQKQESTRSNSNILHGELDREGLAWLDACYDVASDASTLNPALPLARKHNSSITEETARALVSE